MFMFKSYPSQSKRRYVKGFYQEKVKIDITNVFSGCGKMVSRNCEIRRALDQVYGLISLWCANYIIQHTQTPHTQHIPSRSQNKVPELQLCKGTLNQHLVITHTSWFLSTPISGFGFRT